MRQSAFHVLFIYDLLIRVSFVDFWQVNDVYIIWWLFDNLVEGSEEIYMHADYFDMEHIMVIMVVVQSIYDVCYIEYTII